VSVIDDALTSYFKRYPLPPQTIVGVAVSGGADSLCLAYHLANYAAHNNLVLKAVTVDHGLRSESTQEALYVHNLMAKIGVEHTILTWTGKKPHTRIEEKARQKRYELMEKWCQKSQIHHLFLAHHQGDQSETFWARLARGSGVDGLSGIADCSPMGNLILCRPFLNLSKKVLMTDLKKNKIAWCEDLMNQDKTYERVRWRQRQEQLSDFGLPPEKIALSCRRLARARQALNTYADRFYTALADLSPKGYFTVQEQAFSTIPEEIQLRVMTKILNCLHPSTTPVSLEALERWLDEYPKSATLGGCILVRQKGILFIAREAKHLKKSVKIKPSQLTLWNNFLILSSVPVQLILGDTDKNLPFAVRQAIPNTDATQAASVNFVSGTQKELEKKFAIEYKRKTSEIILISFEGKK